MKHLLVIVITCAVLSNNVTAQSRLRLDSGDAAYWAGAGIGTGLTATNPKRLFFLEPGPVPYQVHRGAKSLYSTRQSFLIRGGIWGGIETFQFVSPRHRRLCYWSKVAAGITYGLIGILRDKDQWRFVGPTSVTPLMP